MQIVGLLMLATLIHYSSLPTALWLPPWVCMFTIWAAVIPVALHFRRVDLGEHNYRPWRWLLLGWRGLHGLSGGILCGLLYGGLSPEWRIPLLIVVVVFTYGLTFFAIEDLGVAMIGSGPVVLSLLLALLHSGRPADHMLAVLLIAASINGWLAGHAISADCLKPPAFADTTPSWPKHWHAKSTKSPSPKPTLNWPTERKASSSQPPATIFDNPCTACSCSLTCCANSSPCPHTWN